MRKGLAASTLKTYDFTWRTFAMFCFSVGITLKPVLISNVCAFMCYCATDRHLKPQYIRGLLAGVQFNVRCSDPGFPSLFANQSVKLILKGLIKTFPPVLDRRRPITLSTLRLMLSKLRSGLFSPYIDALLDALFLLAFYAFLRPGEFTTASLTFDSNRDVSFSDISFHASHFSLYLKHSKCGGACSVIAARIDSQFCPYKSMIKFLQLRPTSNPLSPLFLISGNYPLTQRQFNIYLKQVLIKSGLSPLLYTGHSFRIGAATSAANQGVSSSSLQQLGRWSSSAFSSYIRPDLNAVLAIQRSLQP
ncbi:uncharacterized protein LOC117559108 [Gymnodraco acuticeps]|uniref:Uncharacterized protein LOC117559108 n=1 Tax=Gymnodraco acuticeps TaxID=8218 RepID=A0A6P8VM16_GYMAC|nr:uncharacterized protein LOC117559108 [Gymnodraco acuticeps]